MKKQISEELSIEYYKVKAFEKGNGEGEKDLITFTEGEPDITQLFPMNREPIKGDILVVTRGLKDGEEVSVGKLMVKEEFHSFCREAAAIDAEPSFEFFLYRQLPENLQGVSSHFYRLALSLIEEVPDCEQRMFGLQKLIEAKDCMVRASL